MRGHTDKATINERKPLTHNMWTFLRGLNRRSQTAYPGGARSVYFRGELLQREKNAARALLERGLVGWDAGMHAYYMNEAGRAAINQQIGKET